MDDLFSDFSFAAAGSPSRRSAFLNDLDMEDISPSSSRSTTPVSFELIPRSPPPPPTSLSVDQLSVRMDRHHIDTLSSMPLCVRLHHQRSSEMGRRHGSTSMPAEFYDTVRRRRQEGARHLCSSVRLASIETLVDRMLRDGSSCYASLHPSSTSPGASRAASRNPSVTSAPTSIPVSHRHRSSSHSDDSHTTDDDSADDDGLLPTVANPVVAKLRFGSGAAAAVRRSGGIEKASHGRRKAIGRR